MSLSIFANTVGEDDSSSFSNDSVSYAMPVSFYVIGEEKAWNEAIFRQGNVLFLNKFSENYFKNLKYLALPHLNYLLAKNKIKQEDVFDFVNPLGVLGTQPDEIDFLFTARDANLNIIIGGECHNVFNLWQTANTPLATVGFAIEKIQNDSEDDMVLSFQLTSSGSNTSTVFIPKGEVYFQVRPVHSHSLSLLSKTEFFIPFGKLSGQISAQNGIETSIPKIVYSKITNIYLSIHTC